MLRHTICFTVLILASVCWAKRIIVPDNFPTIQNALTESMEGDTVYVRIGTYKETIRLEDNVTLLGEDREKTIIRGNRRRPVIMGADGAVLKNFTITNGSTGIFIFCLSTRTIISGNSIRNNKNAGIHAINSLPEITANTIEGNGQFGIFLHRVHGFNTSINENTIREHRHSGIYCFYNTDVLIVKNIIEHNRFYGVFTRESSNSRVFNNDFFLNRFPFNQLVVCDKNNKFKKDIDTMSRQVVDNDTLRSYYGISGTCQSIDLRKMNIPIDRDHINSCFYRRYSDRLLNRLCCGHNYVIQDGFRSYQQSEYWDAAQSLGKSITLYPNYPQNAKALNVMANSFIHLGLLQCAKNTLDFGLTKFPTSSYIMQFYVTYLRIAFLEENPENIELYYARLQNYCLNEDIQKEIYRIRKISEKFNSKDRDILIQQTAISDHIKQELSEYESLLFTCIMKKPIQKVVDSMIVYKKRYDDNYRAVLDNLYSTKLSELDIKGRMPVVYRYRIR